MLTEIKQIPNLDRQSQVRILANMANQVIQLTEDIEAKATFLNAQGFSVYDALHIASAAAGNADVFLTTDDRLLRRAIRQSDILEVKVANPVQWLLEVTGDPNE